MDGYGHDYADDCGTHSDSCAREVLKLSLEKTQILNLAKVKETCLLVYKKLYEHLEYDFSHIFLKIPSSMLRRSQKTSLG
jgi:hypothetical protein